MTRPDRTKTEASTPDLDSLDAAWEEDAPPIHSVSEIRGGDAGVPSAPSASDAFDVDDGWETVPDPLGGPPQRRRVSPKERARRKRDRQRVKADAATAKQKGKKRGGPGRRDSVTDTLRDTARDLSADVADADEGLPPVTRALQPATSVRQSVTKRANSGERARAVAKSRQRTYMMVGAAFVIAAGALYFMMTNR